MSELYAHQVECLRLMGGREEFALFLDLGLGKSCILINDICRLFSQGKITGALIVAPKGVCPVWINEQLPKWLTVDSLVVEWTPNQTLKAQEALQCVTKKVTSKLRILVMNSEALSTRKGVLVAGDFLDHGPCLMALDESTQFKNVSANRTKGAIWLGKIAEYRRILTGFPIEQSPLDLYSQCEFLCPGLLGHRSYYSFRGAYANLMPIKLGSGGRTIQKVTGYRNLDRLSKTLQSFSYRVTKAECLDLPQKVYQTVEVELTSEQTRAYKDMRAKAVVAIGEADQKSTAVIALSQVLRLQQIVCGFLPMDNGTTVEIPSNRLNVLLGLLEETQGKVIIWANYKKSVLAIWNALFDTYGIDSCVSYYGDSDDRPGSLEKFKNDPACRFFIGTPRTGGMGLNLTEANTVIYYSNSYSVRDRVQSEDRAHRIGQTRSVTYVDLIVRGTVDEVILKALKDKRELADLVVDGRWGDLF